MSAGANTWKAESVRKRFRDWIAAQSGQDLPGAIFETIVLSGGCYVGRRFSLLGFSLMWLIDQQQIKLFGPDGSMVQSESIEEFCKYLDPLPPSSCDPSQEANQ